MVIIMDSEKEKQANNNYSFYDAKIVLPHVNRLSSPPMHVPQVRNNERMDRNFIIDRPGKLTHNAKNQIRPENGVRERQFGLQDTLLESIDSGQSSANPEQHNLFVPQPPSKPKLTPTRNSLRPIKQEKNKDGNNLSSDKDLINMYKEFLNQRYCKNSTSGDEDVLSSGSDFSVSSLTGQSSSDENTDSDLGNKTLTTSSFQPLYSLPRKDKGNKLARPKQHNNLLNKIVISNSRTIGDDTYLSACKAGSLPDLRSLDNIDIKKVSHVTKNESEAESEPGAERSYKFRPLPSIPGTSSNISSNLYETLDGLRSQNEISNLPERKESKHRSFKEIASFLTLIPRLTTRSVRSRENDHRLADITQYLPDKKLKIFVGTWNMKGTRELPDSLDDFLLPPDSVYLQDIYVIGTQEGTPFRREWQVRLQETFGPSHVLMQSSNFGVLQLSIFIRRELVWFCSSVEQDTTATRMGHKIKTKGALAMSFSVFGTSFLFITSHFTSHEGKLRDRINDYKAICRNIQLPYTDPSTDDVTNRFDRVFWFGDFNFRVKKPRDVVDRMLVKYKENEELVIKELLQHDQLNDIYKRGKIFHGFTEAPINFMPTYKFDVYTDDYDTSSKRRVPSWTDRIVYRSKQVHQVQSICYNSCDSIKNSDHRPVYAIFEASVEPYNKNKFAVTGATYDRDVYVEANLRRSAPRGSQVSSNICTIL